MGTRDIKYRKGLLTLSNMPVSYRYIHVHIELDIFDLFKNIIHLYFCGSSWTAGLVKIDNLSQIETLNIEKWCLDFFTFNLIQQYFSFAFGTENSNF